MNQNNINLLKRIFPYENCKNMLDLKFDSEGLWSITHPENAENISKNIKIFEKTGIKLDTIFDMTGGIGGNTISFCKYFKHVISAEIDENRFKILQNNINNYNYNNHTIIHCDAVKEISKLKREIDVIFIDAPWGGPEYKSDNDIQITLSGLELDEIVKLASEYNYNNHKIKVITLKLPYNYNFDKLLSNVKNYIKTKNKVVMGNVVYIHLLLN